MEAYGLTDAWAQSRLCAQLARSLRQLLDAGLNTERISAVPLPHY